MEPEPTEVADLAKRFEEALAQRGLQGERNLVPWGDGHLHSVEEVVAFVHVADADANGWEQVTGFFHALDGLDAKWSAIQLVADSVGDGSKLSMLAVFAFEAIIEETRDELPMRLEIAVRSPAVRTMLASCWVSSRYVDIIEPYIERDA